MTDDDPAPFGLRAEIVKVPAVEGGLYRYYCNISNSAKTHWSGLVRVELLDNGGGAVAGQKTQLQVPAGASKFVTVDFHRPGLTRVRLTVPE